MIIRLDAEWREAEDREIFLGPPDGVGFRNPFPDTHALGFERASQPFFSLETLIFDLFAFSDITSDRLKFDDLPVRVQYGVVTPLLPADAAAGQQHLVLVHFHSRVF